ncbi:MAG: rod shape-determining protein MreC, partial [Ilumatobacteraceae bacterium]|nr:rod shape-determining protein MreC [Ilumatobacteraceae bacterium]
PVEPTAVRTTDPAATSTAEVPTTNPGHFAPYYPTALATVSDSGDALTIDLGSNDGIQLGMPVVDMAQQLLGDIIGVQATTSTVRRVTDSSYSIACSVADVAAQCAGAGAGQPLRIRSSASLTLPPSGQVVTGGGATSSAPPGILIGDVHDGHVDLAADPPALSTVNVVLYVPADEVPIDDDPQSLGLTGPLPDELQIWDVVQATNRLTQPKTQELFGTLTADGSRLDHGVLLTISPRESSLPNNAPLTASVRGIGALPGTGGSSDPTLTWTENSSVITAEWHGMSTDDVNAVLDGLQWRADPQDGFDPTSSSSPLISESVHRLGEVHAVTYYVLARSAAKLGENGDDGRPMRVTIGDSYADLSPAAVIYGGVKDASGTVECDGCFADDSMVALSPFGMVIGLGAIDHGLDPQLLAAIGPIKPSQLAAQTAAATDLDGSLEVLASATIGPVTVEQRGVDPISATAQCVVVDVVRRCRTYEARNGADAPPLTVTSVVIDGTWYIVAVVDSGTALPNYTVGTTPLVPTSATAEGRTWAVFTVPSGVDSIGVNGAPGDGSAARGGFLRPVTDTASISSPSLPAPIDGSPTPGATTTTTTNVLGTPYNFTPLIPDAAPDGFALESAIYFPEARQYFGMVTYRSTTGDGVSLQLIIRPGDEWLQVDRLTDRQRWTVGGRTVIEDSQTPGCDPDACSVGVKWDDNTEVSLTMYLQTDGTISPTQTLEVLRDLVGHLVVDPTAFTPGTPSP